MLRPLSDRVSEVVLFKPTLPPNPAVTVPERMSKVLVLLKMPLVMTPLLRRTPASVLLKPPMSNVPPLTTKLPLLANWSAALRARVPPLTVVAPV